MRPIARSADSWAATEPLEEKAEREKRWLEFKSCADCQHWEYEYNPEYDEGDDGIGICIHPSLQGLAATFFAPEDYFCKDFESKNNGEATRS